MANVKKGNSPVKRTSMTPRNQAVMKQGQKVRQMAETPVKTRKGPLPLKGKY